MQAPADARSLGPWMHTLLRRLFPICRSLAGPGNRETLRILSETLPLAVSEVPSGTPVFDWTVPDEWTPRAGEIVGPDGVARARFADCNLNLASHSAPVDAEMEREELLPHIFTLPDQPTVVPYVTRYYQRGWGFCMSEAEKRALPPGRYRVRIDADLKPGAMSYGEALLAGESAREVLISTYICHPSMANDNLSGIVVATALWRLLAALPRRRLSYRFVFVPETIGSLAWLARNHDTVKSRTVAGLVLSCIGDDGPFCWKETRLGNTALDRLMAYLGGTRIPFTPVMGSDERQYCSPGFDLPVVMLSRSHPGSFAFYHTAADTPAHTPAEALGASLEWVARVVAAIEANALRYRRTDPYGEPMLSKRGLYHTVSIRKGADFDRARDPRSALMWVLSLSDGEHDLLAIAERSGIALDMLAEAAVRAEAAGLIAPVEIAEG